MSLARRIRLPRTDLDVSPICLGGNRLGGELDQAASFALLDAFVAAGGNFIDTAHVYANWLKDAERSCSEKTLGRWLRARGGTRGVVIATKGGSPEAEAPEVRRLDEGSLRRDLAESLEFMGVSTIDLYYLHRDDPARPVEELLALLEDMKTKGQIRHYGASNWSVARLEEAESVCRARGWSGFAANQCEWSFAKRNAGTTGADMVQGDAAMAAWHRRHGIAAVPYSSQAKGWFDKVATGRQEPLTDRLYDNAGNRALAPVLAAAAQAVGSTPTQAMLARMMQAPFPFVPIIGPRSVEQMRSSVASLALPPVEHGLPAV
ncbi:MAG TPA: aldo/keto reductase [Beijerinckiaceae bacterium]|nr:aldo/keto reductase [Beijerinckiaceae bacterium]